MPMITFSGLASGIDSEALIEATSDASRATKVLPKQNKVAELEDTNSALEEYKTLMDELKDISLDFSTLYGGIVAKKGQSSNEDVITASASNSAQLGTYEIIVNQLAENAIFSYDDDITDTSADMVTGTGAVTNDVIFTVGTGSSQETITITVVKDDTSYEDFVTDFNDQSELATASFVNVGTTESPVYRIMIISENVGEEKGQILLTQDGGMTKDGGSDLFDSADTTLDQATNSQITMSGINTGASYIERSSNTISDVIPGVTFNLESADASAVTVKVENDVSTTTERAQEYVDKYNEIVLFLEENNQIVSEQVGDEITNTFGPLASSTVDDGGLTAIKSGMSASTYTNGTYVRMFADMGIETDRDGTLKFKSDVFEESLGKESESVRQIWMALGDKIGTTGGTIDQYTRFNGLIDTTVTGNDELIQDLNDQIARAEESIAKTESMLRARFARLEATVSEMQNQQSALTSALAGLSG